MEEKLTAERLETTEEKCGETDQVTVGPSQMPAAAIVDRSSEEADSAKAARAAIAKRFAEELFGVPKQTK